MMPIQQCPIDIPDGWEFVRYGSPKKGEHYLDRNGVRLATFDYCGVWLIVRPVRPKLAVGDWVRVNCRYPVDGGKAGEVIDTRLADRCNIRSADGRSFWVERDHLRKQTRTVAPYTIDQCIEAAVRLKSRHVRISGDMALIQSFHIAGVTLSDPYVEFISYVDAADRVQWDGGEAFGVETWEDAE